LKEDLHCLTQYVLPGNLFQTAIGGPYLAVDSRHNETLYITLFNWKSGKLIGEIAPPDLNPWYSLMRVDGSTLTFQHFKNRQNPDILEEVHLPITALFPAYDKQKDTYPFAVGVPELYPEGTEAFDRVAQFLQTDIILGAEYLETSDKFILAYHQRKDRRYQRKIAIYKGRSILMEKIQDKELSGFAPGSFFTYQKRMIFVIDKKEINIYEI